VFMDQWFNIKISRIVVKCPRESCEFNGELGKMANHMGTCDRKPVPCPYYVIGCADDKSEDSKMNRHLKQENFPHAKLLMDFIDIWRNEMTLLKINMKDLQKENEGMKGEMGSKQEKILGLEENVTKLLQEIRTFKDQEAEKRHEDNQVKGTVADLKAFKEQATRRMEMMTEENTCLRAEVESIKLHGKASERIISILQKKSEEAEEKMGKWQGQWEMLEGKAGQMENRIEELDRENQWLRRELGTVQQNMTQQETVWAIQAKMEEQNQGIKENTEQMKNVEQRLEGKWDRVQENQAQMKTAIDKMTGENAAMATKSELSSAAAALKTLESEITQIRANQNCGEFLWCIPNWQDKRKRAQDGTETEICSEPFYSHKNGYKMCLTMRPGGFDGKGTHVFWSFCLMRGEFDNILQWPFPHAVKLELMNQETGLAHDSRICDYKCDPTHDALKKPTRERNEAFYYRSLIPVSELSSNAALRLGDQILIRATPLIEP